MTRKTRVRGLAWMGAALLCVGAARHAYAGATMTGETGLVTIPTTEVLAPWQVRTGFYGSGQIGSDAKNDDRDLNRVDFSLGAGLIENLEVYSHLPLVLFRREAKGLEDTTTNGGLRLGFKYRLLDEADGAPVSAALLSDIVVGVGSDRLPAILDRSTAFGQRETYEVMGIVDRTLWVTRSGEHAVFTLNAGGLFFDKPKHFSLDNQGAAFRRRYTGPDTTFDTPFEFAAGLKTPLAALDCGKLVWTEEFRGNTGTIEELRGAIPMQLFSGFRWTLPETTGLALQGGVDIALSGVLDQYRYLVGLTWEPHLSRHAAPVVAQVAPPPPPAPPVVPVKKKIVLRGVNFDFDKAIIRPDSLPILREAASTLKENAAIQVVVEGHTDGKGTDAYNDKLSLRRADAVRNHLVKLGVAESRLTVSGKGKRQPVASNDTDEGRAQNRRVELLVR